MAAKLFAPARFNKIIFLESDFIMAGKIGLKRKLSSLFHLSIKPENSVVQNELRTLRKLSGRATRLRFASERELEQQKRKRTN